MLLLLKLIRNGLNFGNPKARGNPQRDYRAERSQNYGFRNVVDIFDCKWLKRSKAVDCQNLLPKNVSDAVN